LLPNTRYQDLEDIEPITVAAYIETLQRQAAPPTVKQHMAAIRMLFSWLTEKGVLAMNPAREVKTERFSRTEGKTPAFVEGEVQKLLEVVETSTQTGLRGRFLPRFWLSCHTHSTTPAIHAFTNASTRYGLTSA